jgi:hypothetical protein
MRASSGAIGVAITSAVSVVALYLLHSRHGSCRSYDDENLNKDDIAKPISDESKEDHTDVISTSSHEPVGPLKAASLQNADSFLLCLDPSCAVCIPPTLDVTHSPTSVVHPTKKIHDKADMPSVPLKYKQDTGMQTGNSAEVAAAGNRHLLIPRSSSLSSLLPKSNSLPLLNITTSRRNSDVPVGAVSKSKVSEQSEGFIISLEDLVMCNELMLQRADEDRLYESYYDYRDDVAAESPVRRPRRHSDACLLVGDC